MKEPRRKSLFVVVQVTLKVLDGPVVYPEVTFVYPAWTRKEAIEMQNTLRTGAADATFFEIQLPRRGRCKQ